MLFNNTEHLRTVQCDGIGAVEFIQVERANLPKGLRKPYEYVVSIKKGLELYTALFKYLKKQEKTGRFQCCGVSKKALAKGIRLFVLSDYANAPMQIEWEEFCEKVQKILFRHLGQDAKIYADPYTTTDKFQARYETYILYKELA